MSVILTQTDKSIPWISPLLHTTANIQKRLVTALNSEFEHSTTDEGNRKKASKSQCGAEEEEAWAEADTWVRADCGWLTWWLPLLCAYFTLVCLILMGSDKSLNVAEDGEGVLLWTQHEKGLCWPSLPPGCGAALGAMHRPLLSRVRMYESHQLTNLVRRSLTSKLRQVAKYG